MIDKLPDGVIKAIFKYGFTTVAAVVLGYLYVGEIRADQKSLVIEQQNLARGVLKLADKQGETQILQEKILGVLRAMCVQQAGNAQERLACIREQ